MKIWIYALLMALFMGLQHPVSAQNMSDLSSINVDDLSDTQIEGYWLQAQAQGYSMSDLEAMAALKGMSALEISKLKQRLSGLSVSQNSSSAAVGDRGKSLMLANASEVGLTGNEIIFEKKQSTLFGYDFFNNENISFEPNVNIATPKTYRIGPGDEVLIDVWGAAENSYRKEVDRRGAIVIENVGPVYISGLEIESAKRKIISYLKKIYGGISAPSNSFNKVHAEVSLVGVRTVQVNIIGEVKVPGTYSLSALSSVLNGLYAAGGPTEKGTFRAVKLIRNGKLHSEFDIYKYLIEGSQKGNDFLQDKDILIVKPYISKITVKGNVKRPGVYELKESETIEDLVGFFSGFTAEAYKERLLVNRINGSQKEVYEIGMSEDRNFRLQDGDALEVQKITDRYLNRVRIEGAVYRPGSYELSEHLTLLDLIKKADGLKENAFLDRGLVYRTINDVDEEIISFSVAKIMKGATSLKLQREDSVQVFAASSLKEAYTVKINGAVNNALQTKFYENMRIEDLILMAGGYKEGADPSVIDVARKVIDTNFSTLSENIKQTSTFSLSLDSTERFYLKPFDEVSVRYKKGYSKKINASVQGEVLYPGTYVITNKDERISDLIDKCGGFSPYAYQEGVTLIRRTAKATDEEQLKLLQNLIVKDSLGLDVTQKKEFMVGIELDKILGKNGRHSAYDLILKEGDVLVVPSEKQTVAVQGEVLVPSLIRYEKSKSLKDYINNSGGFSENAKKKKTYVVYANGNVESTSSFLWFKKYPKLQPGAIVLVPKSEPKKKMTAGEIIGLSSALLSLALLVQNLTK